MEKRTWIVIVAVALLLLGIINTACKRVILVGHAPRIDCVAGKNKVWAGDAYFYWCVRAPGEFRSLSDVKAVIDHWFHGFSADDYFFVMQPYDGRYTNFCLRFSVSVPWCGEDYHTRGVCMEGGWRWDLINFTPVDRSGDGCGDNPKSGEIYDSLENVCPGPPALASADDGTLWLWNNYEWSESVDIISLKVAHDPQVIPLDSLYEGNSMMDQLAFTTLLSDQFIAAGDSVQIAAPEIVLSDQYYAIMAYKKAGADMHPSIIVYRMELVEAEIPTLTEWGFIIFAALLLSWMAIIVLKRKMKPAESI